MTRGTWLAKRHPIQTVQRLMRHGTITLTVDLYNDLDLSDVAEQEWTLPRLSVASGQAPEAHGHADGHAHGLGENPVDVS